MANVYFLVMDVTKDREDPRQMLFSQSPYYQDLSGLVFSIAKRNGTEPEKIKLFIYPTKKAWEASMREFVKRADWSRA